MSKIAKVFIIIFVIGMVLMLSVFTYVAIVISQAGETTSLNIAKLNSLNSQVKIYDQSGVEIVSTSATGNETIELEELPSYVPQAFISIEDKKFYSHHGLNYGRIIKAGIKNLFSGYAKEGASTITQQLIKNTHLTNEKTLTRKIQEAYLATQLEKKYSKDDILETYLNVIYFGNGAYGIESASQNYFGHSAKDLTLDESAILAGLIRSPRTYSPILNPETCINRRNLVLKNMLDDQIIDEDTYNNSITKPLKLELSQNENNLNKIILDEAIKILDLSERDVSTMGFRIYTYIDTDIQNEIAQNIAQFDNLEHGLIVIDNSENNVLAYIGQCDIRRQTGSTIKPLLCYAPAFEMGTLSPITPICDEKINFDGYSPHNASGKYLGWVSTRTAIAKSLNIPAVKTLEYNGLDKSIAIARKFGLTFNENDRHLAIALGATNEGESLINIANAYTVFARNGTYSSPNFIRKITTEAGTTVYENNPQFNKIIGTDTAFLINDVLKDTIKIGTAKRLSDLNFPLSAKTGTVGTDFDSTNTDAWCISYNPQFTVGAWYGNTSGDSTKNMESHMNGGTTASNANKVAWNVLTKHFNINKDFVVPENVKKYKIDTLSLEKQKVELATENTPDVYVVEDWFATRYAPKVTSTNFTEQPKTTLNMEVSDTILLSWQGQEYLEYSLYKKEGITANLIEKITGKDEKLTYSLPLPSQNTEYYLVTRYKNDLDSEGITSNTQKYYINDTSTNSNTKSATQKIIKGWFF